MHGVCFGPRRAEILAGGGPRSTLAPVVQQSRFTSVGLGLGLMLACGSLVVACSAQPRVALLELSSQVLGEPQRIEPGAQLELAGAGFPAGQRGEARFVGAVHAPGRTSRNVDCEAEVIASSTDRLQVAAEPLLAELGARGTFEGRVEVAFAAQDAEVTLTGTEQVSFDFADPAASSAAQEHALRVDADKLLDRIGLVVELDAMTHDGVHVRGALPGSAAASLGLRSGDVLEMAGGVRVHALGDLVPAPSAAMLELRVRRAGTSRAPLVRVPLDGVVVVSPLPLTRMSWLLGWALACSVFFASGKPFASRIARLRARFAAVHELTLPLGLFGAWSPEPERRLRRLALALAVSFAGVLLVCFEPAALLSVRSITLYLPIVAVGVALALMQGSSSARDRVSLSARVHAALALLGRMAVMGAVLACACALAGTRALDGIVATQGALPWSWGVMTSPALLAAFPLFVVYGAQIGDATEPKELANPSAMQRLVELERVVTNVVLAALGAAIFWGGWQSTQWLTLGPWPERLPGALLFVLKTWCMAMLLARSRRSRVRLGALHTAILCMVMIGCSVLDVWLEPGESVSIVIGQGLCVALLGLFIATLFAGFSAKPKRDQSLWIAARDV